MKKPLDFLGVGLCYLHAFLFVFFLFGSVFASKAQGQTTIITGNVTSVADGLPLPGVSIIDVNDPTNGVVTDFDGNYSITLKSASTNLRFSYIGFKASEMATSGKSVINVALMEDVASLDEVVVVGYGTQKKATVTGAVSAVKGAVLEESPNISVSNSLAGRLPGLVVIQTSGEPGEDEANISIRGSNTLGNNSPLIVIDGIPDRAGGIGRLNSSDIENISVLKDASAAIYGARSANGAIIVTTKQGKSDKPSISFEYNYGFSQPTRIPQMSNAVEYANIMNEIPIYKNIPVNEWQAASSSIKSTGVYDSPTDGIGTLNANFSPEAVQKYGDGSDTWLYPNTDWFDDTFKQWSGQSKSNLSISGGGEDVKYYASLGYLNQDAYYKNSATDYNQYDFRLNITAKVNDYISAKLGIMVKREDRNFPTESAGSIFRMLMRGRPTEPAVWPNGEPGPDIENGQNPVVITTNATGYDKQVSDFMQFTGSVDITNPWVEGLKLTLLTGIDNTNARTKTWQTPWKLYYLDKDHYIETGEPILNGSIRSNFTDPRLLQSSSSLLNTNLTALLNYDTKFGDNHTLNVLAGVTQEVFKGDGFFAYRRNFISSAVDQMFAGGSLQQNTGGSGYERARLGYYGRFQYNFKEKYLAEFIWRYDGSYIFPENDRFGFFPGVLVGWNVSNEDFFKVDFVDYLKIRASYGQMGNDQVFYNGSLQEYAYLPTYGFGEYPINSVVETTLQETVLANPSFTWEKANNFNVGLDAIILDGAVNFTLEYFYNKRDNILIQKTGSTPASSGISNLLPPVNDGKVDNQGFEFAVNYYGGQNSDFKYDFGINGGYANNEVVFMDEIPGAPSYQRQEGKPINAYLVYESDGAFLNEQEIAANTLDYSEVTPQLKPGDMKFKDVNGDGIINGDDQVRLDESIVPKFNYGITGHISYKGFDLSLLFQGASGASVRFQTESGDIGNYLKYSYDHRWSIDNPSSEHPRLASRGDTYFTGGNYGNNTYYLYSKNYIRLKNLQFGYNLPSKFIEPLGLEAFKVYVSGGNLITWDKYKIFDPETTSQSGQYYPQARVINTGFSLTF